MAHYKKFLWHNQTIDGNFVQSVRVRLFPPLAKVKANKRHQLISTDGKLFQRGSMFPKTDITDYSYVILSTDIHKMSRCNTDVTTSILLIKLYSTSDFNPSMLDGIDFLGKSYLMDALNSNTIQNEL